MLPLALLSSKLQLTLGCFEAKCEAAGMKISTSKSEAMVFSWKRFREECCPKWRREQDPKYVGSCYK